MLVESHNNHFSTFRSMTTANGYTLSAYPLSIGFRIGELGRCKTNAAVPTV